MSRSRAGRPRRELRPGELPAKVNIKRLRDLERYYMDDERVRWAKSALCNARKRARKSGVDCDITYADLLDIAVTHCPALGIELNYSRGRMIMMDDSATVDRLIAPLGYVKGNITVISARANACKSRCTSEEIMAVSRWTADALTAAEIVAVTGLDIDNGGAPSC